MATIWDRKARDEVLTRLDRLRADTPARWGKFTCPDMLGHLNDSMRMALGDVTPRSKKLPLRFFPLKQLILYVVPFPKGAPTAPELIQRTGSCVWDDEVKTFKELLGRLASRSEAREWPTHPAFGAMSRRDWGVLGYKHIAHHFSQFGA
jgi:hypothetical protein